jgi:hypothetical protein
MQFDCAIYEKQSKAKPRGIHDLHIGTTNSQTRKRTQDLRFLPERGREPTDIQDQFYHDFHFLQAYCSNPPLALKKTLGPRFNRESMLLFTIVFKPYRWHKAT